MDQLDTLACGGIDSLTSALPALTSPTPELVESTKEAARGYFAWAKEYAASFTVAQISLKARSSNYEKEVRRDNQISTVHLNSGLSELRVNWTT